MWIALEPILGDQVGVCRPQMCGAHRQVNPSARAQQCCSMSKTSDRFILHILAKQADADRNAGTDKRPGEILGKTFFHVAVT